MLQGMSIRTNCGSSYLCRYSERIQINCSRHCCLFRYEKLLKVETTY